MASRNPGRLGGLFTAEQVEAAIGLPRTGRLPVRAPCPLCRGVRFSIYQDRGDEERWYACGTCRFAGDAADLLAAVRRVTTAQIVPFLPATAAQRAALTTAWPRERARYEADRDRARAALAQARKHLVADFEGAAGRLLARRYRTTGLRAKQWGQSALSVVGSGDVGKLERALSGDAPVAFAGTGWGTGLVCEYELAPGLPAGYWLSADATRGERATYVPACPGHCDGGLWGLATLESGRWFADGGCAFAVPSVAVAASLQARMVRAGSLPAPVVAWIDCRREERSGATPVRTGTLGWQAVWDRKVVFLTDQLDAATLAQATLVDGRVNVSARFGPPGAEATRRYFDHNRTSSVADVLAHALGTARPWEDVAVEWARSRPRIAVADMVDAVRAAGGLADAVAEAVGVDPVAARPPRASVRVGGKSFYAAASGWYMIRDDGTAVRVWDRPFRMKRLVMGGPKGPEYEVEIPVLGEDPAEFTAPFEAFELDPKKYVTRACHAAGLPTPGGDAGARPGVPLAELAKAFHRPEEVRVKPDRASVDQPPVDPVLGGVERVKLRRGVRKP